MDSIRAMANKMNFGAAVDMMDDATLLSVVRQVLGYRHSDTFEEARVRGHARLAAFGFEASEHFDVATEQVLFWPDAGTQINVPVNIKRLTTITHIRKSKPPCY